MLGVVTNELQSTIDGQFCPDSCAAGFSSYDIQPLKRRLNLWPFFPALTGDLSYTYSSSIFAGYAIEAVNGHLTHPQGVFAQMRNVFFEGIKHRFHDGL